jgi:hypothetical protein
MGSGVSAHEMHTWDGNVESAVVENVLYVAIPMDDGHVLGMTGDDAEKLRAHLDLALKGEE